jgi:hypothetical protein
MKRCVNLALSEELVQIIDARRSTDQGEVPRSAFVEKELKQALLPTHRKPTTEK